MKEKIRIAIGTEPRTEIAKKVLEFSIVKNTKSNIEFHSLMGQDYYDRGEKGQGTGFSFYRFKIPELFNYTGKAIYLDADMLVLADIKELWDLIDEKNPVCCVYGNEFKEKCETSVMGINCEISKNRIKTVSEIENYIDNDPDRKKYREIMKLDYLKPRPKELSKWWNVMDKGSLFTNIKDFASDNVKLLHYTDVRKQPWFKPEHPYSNIWGKWFKMAVKENYISIHEIKAACKKYDISNPRRPNGLHKYWLTYLGE